jgi:AcrR family transcriptional regulator
MKMSAKDRIQRAALLLFNQAGVATVTTNHLAAHLGMSPGNLYFHYRNKEEIVRDLFSSMTSEVYAAFRGDPSQTVRECFEVFWRYRCLHREIYHLRRRDPILARRWKLHLRRAYVRFAASAERWGWSDADLPRHASTLLIHASSFVQFHESQERAPTRRSVEEGVRSTLALLHDLGRLQGRRSSLTLLAREARV